MTFMDGALGDRLRAYIEANPQLAAGVVGDLRAILAGQPIPSAKPAHAEPTSPFDPCPEGFHWIGQGFDTCDQCGLPAWEHAGMAGAPAGAGPFDGTVELQPWKPGEREATARKWQPVLLDRLQRKPAPAEWCDPVRGRHVTPHRGCILRPVDPTPEATHAEP